MPPGTCRWFTGFQVTACAALLVAKGWQLAVLGPSGVYGGVAEEAKTRGFAAPAFAGVPLYPYLSDRRRVSAGRPAGLRAA